MKRLLLKVLCGVLCIAGGVAAWRSYSAQYNILPLYCSSESQFVEGDLAVNARYIILFNHGTGMFSINGIARDGHEQSAISRQVHFSYRYSGEGFTLESTQIERLHNESGEQHTAERLLPSFFSATGRFLTLAMDRDQYDNRLLTFGDLPVFYCVPRKTGSKS